MVGSLLLVALVACGLPFGIGAKFALSNAKVDSSYSCPNPAENLPYDVHVNIQAQNATSNSVSIKSISETWTNVAVHGNWSGTKGDHGTTDVSDYTPKSVSAGRSATIKFAIPFECTNSGAGSDTYGDFSFKFVVKTSTGSYTLSSDNTHRLTFST
jgi:hypothetical protein